MRTVKVNKEELLGIMRDNRDAHRETFEQAYKVFEDRCLEEMKRNLDDGLHGRKIRRHIDLIEPIDYTKEYDRIIKMVEMSIDDTIELDARDFARFVMDDWEWKEAFTTSTQAYLAT